MCIIAIKYLLQILNLTFFLTVVDFLRSQQKFGAHDFKISDMIQNCSMGKLSSHGVK